MTKISVSIAGVTGYTGEELLRLCALHPHIQIDSVFASSDRIETISDLYPYHKGRLNLNCKAFDPVQAANADAVFLALPHGLSMKVIPELRQAKAKKIIDLSADYRLESSDQYPKYYNFEHTDSAALKQAVYGMPELNRASIKNASFVANPGCYPTSIILGLWPLLKQSATWSGPLVIDSKSGVSGAGKKVAESLQYSEVNENFKAYKISAHSHEGEIAQALLKLGADARFSFVPHLLPMTRGILSTIYIHDLKGINDVEDLYRQTYDQEPFVHIANPGKSPEVKDVLNTNQCHIGLTYKEQSNTWILISVIDNLLKGAASQAIQNFNLMHDLPEDTGLS